MTDHTDLDAAARDELTRRAHGVIAANKYMTLATVDRDGDPWISPVFFAPDTGRRFLWASSPEALHSRNIAEHPGVSVVVYDSSVPIGGARAVYVRAVAGVVPDDELEALAVVYSNRLPEQRVFSADDLRDELRLYQAVVRRSWMLVTGRDADYGTGIDRRVEVSLSSSVADGVGAGAAER
jgi:Pyridoxamine 5'-phosphate oxidase